MSGSPGNAIAGETCPINPYCCPQGTSERVIVMALLSPRRRGVRGGSLAFWHALSTLAPPGLEPQCLSYSSHTPHIHKHTIHTIQTHTAHTSIHYITLPMYKHKYTTHTNTPYSHIHHIHTIKHTTYVPHTLYKHTPYTIHTSYAHTQAHRHIHTNT